ncbi:acyl-CoA thioester hydrolase/BAAT C-terminal domain-containing protein [Ralstonia soli]|uniref:Acyl-CoA thioesterase/BAAT N-terminal domain-containing protein n=2 Tax=Bacteria TaxID=2 RepID=A0ABT1ASZ0_9RALS|nr:acyl-CoA thioester hydrolase/BAAT C-terminal domain-containing protein [Ralstonia soli]MCO5401147.1 acyl-CoA thioesterase/BAAT N-terminal domain-containing protein [Ralstonia soli]
MGNFVLSVTPADDLIDVSRQIVVTGLAPGAQVGIVAQTNRAGNKNAGVLWHARAAFVADAQGTVDLTRDAPVSGDGISDYSGVSAMGLVWSQRPEDGKAREVFPPLSAAGFEPLTTTLTATANGESVHASFVQRLAAPGVTRHEVRDEGLVGTLYLPDPYAHPGPRPAVLILNGSGGGINEPRAALYASHGYAAFALAYFKAPGLSDYISNTPLEYFERALAWLRKRVEPLHDFVAVSGQSRGGELALLLGATFPEAVSAVIGYVPGAVVHSGQNAADPAVGREGPTWLYRGQPLPHLWEGNRTASWAPFDEGPAPHRHERAIRTALQDPDAVARARIRIERARGPVLLLSATDDGSWPSGDYSRMVTAKLAEVRHPYPVEHFDYEGAGHAIVFPYVPTTQLVYAHPVSGRISTGGGEPRANARADAQSWAAVRRFLASAVAARGASVPDSRSLSSMDFTPTQDVVDHVAGLDEGSTTHALRHTREKVATATQGSYDGLFDAALPGLTLGERLLVALYACRLTPAPELAEHYRLRLADTPVDTDALQAIEHGDVDAVDTLADTRLRAILAFTRTLVERPIEGDRDALLRLPAAGLATADVVTLAQLIAFLSYQTRLVAGLRALNALNGANTSPASTETAA